MLSGRPIALRVVRLTILLVVGLLLVATTSPASAATLPPARETAAAAPAVSVLIDSITPLSPGPKDTLKITGRVVDRSAPGLTAVHAALHMGSALPSRSKLNDLRVVPVPQPLVPDPILLADGKLNPGHALTFSLSFKISDLRSRGLLQSAGVYPMQVTATGFQDGIDRDLATASTFLPYIPTAAAAPATPLAWLIPLTADPTLLADGNFTSSALTASVADGGRLKQLLDALQSASSASVTLDPALIRTLSLAANGRYVVSVPGKTTGRLEPANSAAKDWLTELRASSNLNVIPLPYDDVDVEALLHNGGRSLADAARKRGDDVLKLGLLHTTTSVTSDIAVPPDGLVDAAGARYYRTAAKASALVLSADAVPSTGDNPSASAKSSSTPTQLLLADDVLSRLVTAGVPAGTTPRMAEQEVIAELAEAHIEDGVTASPGKGAAASSARPLLIKAPDGWSPSVAWLSRLLADTSHLSWLSQTSVSSLLDSPTEPRAGLQYPDDARADELPSALVRSSLKITANTTGLFSNPQPAGKAEPQSPDSILQPIRDAALAAVSRRWRSDPNGAFPFRNSAEIALTSVAQQVKVVASPQVTLTSHSGKVPVTLENDLGAAVDVSLVLTSLDRSRVSSDTIIKRTVRAGQKVQVEVEVKAANAGTFPVRLTLYTTDGRPLGTPVQVLVRSTTYGVVATAFTIVALSILGLAVLFRAVRGLIRRSRRTGQAPPAPASDP